MQQIQRYKLDFTRLDKSTLFLSTCKLSIKQLHSANRRERKKSITWRYAEHSDVANVTSVDCNGVYMIASVSVLLNVHTMLSNALYTTLNPHIIYICSVNILCVDATEMLFGSTIPPHSLASVKLSVIRVCPSVILAQWDREIF